MKNLTAKFLIAVVLGMGLGTIATPLLAQFAPPTAAPTGGEVAPPLADTYSSPIKQSAFAVGSNGSTNISPTTLLQVYEFGAHTNTLDVQGPGSGSNSAKLENGSFFEKTGQIQIDSDVTGSYSGWAPNSGYSLDTDGPLSVTTFYNDNDAMVENPSSLKLLALQATGTTPRPLCVQKNDGKLVLCPQPPVITNFTINPSSITSTSNMNVIWDSNYATTCTGTNFNTANATTGFITISQSATTTYTLTCTNSAGSDTQTLTVPLVPTVTLTTSPNVAVGNNSIPTITVPAGGLPIHLSWSSTNAVSCTGTNFSTGGAASGNIITPVTQTTTYSLDCVTADGYHTSTSHQFIVSAPGPTPYFCTDEYHLVAGTWTLFASCTNPTTFPFDYNFATHSSTATKRFKMRSPTLSVPAGGTNPICYVDGGGSPYVGAVENAPNPPYWQYANNYVTLTPYSGGYANGPQFSWSVANALANFNSCAQGTGCEAHMVSNAPSTTVSYGLSCKYTDQQGNDSVWGGYDLNLTVGP